MINDTDMYLKYQRMIDDFAWKYSTYGFCDFDEMRSYGNYVFVETIRKYDNKKASFSTYLYINLNRRLKRYFDRQARESWPVIGDETWIKTL